MEIDRNEAWNAFQVDRLRANLPLYPSASALISNNYPPLSFLLVRWLADLGPDPIYVGRILSLLATLAAALGISSIIMQFHGSRRSAFVGALWYLATMSRFYDNYVGMNDPNLLGVAAMIWGLAWVLKVQSSGGSIEAPFVFMATAGFVKHTLLAMPACAFLWILLTDWRSAFRPALAGGLTVLGGLIIFSLVYGPNFLDQLTTPRFVHAHRLIAFFGRLQWVIPALLIWAYWAWIKRRTKQARFTALFVALGLFDHFLQQIGDGVDDNSQFELVAALSVSMGLVFEAAIPSKRLNVSVDASRTLMLGLLILRLLLSSRNEPYLLITSEEFRKTASDYAAVTKSEIKRIAETPGEVSCSIMTVCHFGGKRFVFDSFAVKQRIALGGQPTAVEIAVAKHGIQFETIDARASIAPLRDIAKLR